MFQCVDNAQLSHECSNDIFGVTMHSCLMNVPMISLV